MSVDEITLKSLNESGELARKQTPSKCQNVQVEEDVEAEEGKQVMIREERGETEWCDS